MSEQDIIEKILKDLSSRGITVIATEEEWEQLTRGAPKGQIPYLSGVDVDGAPVSDIPIIPESRRETLNDSRYWVTPWRYRWCRMTEIINDPAMTIRPKPMCREVVPREKNAPAEMVNSWCNRPSGHSDSHVAADGTTWTNSRRKG